MLKEMIKKSLDFDVVVHPANTKDLINRGYQVTPLLIEVRAGRAVFDLHRADRGNLIKWEHWVDDNYKLNTGSIFSVNGISFMIVGVGDFGRRYTCVPMTWFLAPLAGWLYLRHNFHAHIWFSFVSFCIHRRLLLTPEGAYPSWRDFFMLRDQKITDLEKTVKKLERENSRERLQYECYRKDWEQFLKDNGYPVGPLK